MSKCVFVFLIFYPNTLLARRCSLTTYLEKKYIDLFLQSKNLDACSINPRSLQQPLLRELQAALRTNTSCEYTNFDTQLRTVISNRGLPFADRRTITHHFIDSLFNEKTCGMDDPISDDIMNVSKYNLASWFQDPSTIAQRFFGFVCEVQAARRDLAQYRRIHEDPDELWMLESLIIYALRGQVNMTITKKEFIRKVFITTEDYEWWPQNRYYAKMVECMSRMFASYAQDLTEMKQDDELPSIPDSEF